MGAAKARTAAQGSFVKGSSQEKMCSMISTEAKAKADVFPGSDFEQFCKGHYSRTTPRPVVASELKRRPR